METKVLSDDLAVGEETFFDDLNLPFGRRSVTLFDISGEFFIFDFFLRL